MVICVILHRRLSEHSRTKIFLYSAHNRSTASASFPGCLVISVLRSRPRSTCLVLSSALVLLASDVLLDPGAVSVIALSSRIFQLCKLCAQGAHCSIAAALR
jgi:hypothetical protein